MLTNRIEFYPSDTAALHLGATPFSIYNTSSPEQISYLFANAGNRVVITERQFVERIKAARGNGAQPRHIVCVDGDDDGVISLDELETMAAPDFDFEGAWRAVEPDDVLTLIYTSGTTGPPKGVELTHANMLAQCRAVAEVLPLRTRRADHVIPSVGPRRRPVVIALQPDGLWPPGHDNRRRQDDCCRAAAGRGRRSGAASPGSSRS